MTLREKCKKQLERDEDRRKEIYEDSLGIPTIGIGRNLKRGLSDDEIDYLFFNDYEAHLRELHAAFPWALQLDEARLGALLNMAFNIGLNRLSDFKNMLLALRYGKWMEAAAHARDSIWYKQVGQRGPRICKQFETGEWQ